MRGLTGPDIEVSWDPSTGRAPMNFRFGELKPLRWNTGALEMQAEAWGYELGAGRILYYDKNGLMTEGVFDRPPY